MIQRVQSVYLLLVTVLMSLFLVKSYAEISLDNDEMIQFYSFAVQKYINGEKTELIRRTLPLMIMVLMAGIVSFLNIFLYQKRVLQMRMCALTGVLLILQLGLVMFYYSGVKIDYRSFGPSFNLTSIFPVISIILLIMAYRAIHHDETLVKSYHRIR
jgi:hypothetical protein